VEYVIRLSGPPRRSAKDPMITCRRFLSFFELFQYILGFLDLGYAPLAVIDSDKPREFSFIEFMQKSDQFFYFFHAHTEALKP
jgi:hypothetical protein